MENKMNGGSVVLLSIVLVATLVVAIIGATYAYFRAQVIQTNVSSMTITTADLEITYNETKNINVTDVLPGWSNTKTFTITNTGNGIVNYTIAWANVTNSFVNKADLTYYVTSTNSGCTKGTSAAQVQFPVAGVTGTAAKICDGSIANGGAAQVYTLNMTYKNIVNSDQSSDMGKSISATIEVITTQVSHD